jgi:hypothetical protein
MKIQNECIPCLFKRILFEAQESSQNKKKQDATLKAAAKAFAEVYSHDTCSADIATRVHKAAYKTLNDIDPYKQLKEMSNQVASSLIPQIKKMISTSDDPLKTSILVSIVGNALDFGIDGGNTHPKMLIDQFQDLISKGFGHDDSNLLKTILKKSNQILYFTDNCGEIVFDKLVLLEIKKQYPNMKIILVAKRIPILSDATIDDTENLGLSTIVDEITHTGPFAVGVDIAHLPQKLKKYLNTNDLIICKGMANYEVFSETTYHPIAYFLRSKCKPIARSMDVGIQQNILKVYN